MQKIPKKIAILALAGIISLTPVQPLSFSSPAVVADAHSGRTDSSGGHRDNKNKSGLGSYHYHCGGHPAHLHTKGVCPYSSSTSNSNSSSTKKTTSDKSSRLVKKVQKKLNALGYDCGTPDGVMGKKTKSALKQYQADNNLKEDGVIGKDVKKSLGIN